MFIKRSYSTKAKRKIPYYQIVQSYREAGKIKHRVLSNLGPLSDKQIDTLVRSFNRLKQNPYPLDELRLEHHKQYRYGDCYLISAFWNRLEIGKRIGQLLDSCRAEFDVVTCVQLLVLNRSTDPMSKLAVSEWQDTIYFKSQKHFSYHQILRALDHLWSIKDPLEESLFEKQVDLFRQSVDLVFFDVTSTYFEGRGPEIAQKGHSRDGKPGNYQLILALAVTKEGLPIGHEVYEGGRKDSKTVVEVVDRLKDRFQIDRTIFVGDRGMVSQENIQKLESRGYEYIFALRKRRLRESAEVIESDLSRYQKIVVDDGSGEVVKLQYLEVCKGDCRYIVCHNPQVAEEEILRLEEALAKKQQTLEQIVEGRRTVEGKLKAISRISKIDRYFRYGITDGNIRYEPNTESVEQERLIAGKYVLKTTNRSLPTTEIVEAYKNLSQIERAFRTIKSFVEIRPMYHRNDMRVRGHVAVCVLAYYVQKLIDLELKRAGSSYSAIKAIEKLGEVRLIENVLGDRRFYQSIKPGREQRQILKTLKIEPIPEAVFKEQNT